MYNFLETVLSFPVVLFSMGLALTSIYWLLVCCGILDSEPVDIDVQALSAYDKATAEAGKGLFFNLGLAGVPISLTLTLVSLTGWLASYFIQLLLIQQLSLGFFYFPLGFVSSLFSLLVALVTTVLVVRVFKPLMRKIKGPPPMPICGQVAVVRSATVTRQRGTALLNDGGAGLLLQVRTLDATELKRNERVVLLQYLCDEHVYLVIAESDFKGRAL